MPPLPRTRVPLGRADLPSGAMRGHRLGPERFVLIVNLDGRYHAIDDWCNHAGCLLSNGRLVDGAVECPGHGARFAVVDGALETLPRICEDQESFPVVVEDGIVYAEVEPVPVSDRAASLDSAPAARALRSGCTDGEGRGEGGE
jgi:3-phenylpropionate/trans-cinnamate dioxygenase ferredoxin subunit